MFKKSLSILLSIAMLASTFSGAFSAFAVEGEGAQPPAVSTLTVTDDSNNAGANVTATGNSNVQFTHRAYKTDENPETSPIKANTIIGVDEDKFISADGINPTGKTATFTAKCYNGSDTVLDLSAFGAGNNISESKYPNLYDNIINQTSDYGRVYGLQQNNEGNSYRNDGSYVDFVYDLGGIYDLSGLVIATPKGHDGNWPFREYEIYTYNNSTQFAANYGITKANIGTPLVDYDVGTGATSGLSNMGLQGYTFTENTLSARFVVLRVTSFYQRGNYGPDHAAQLRLDTFAVYGTKTAEDIVAPLALAGNAANGGKKDAVYRGYGSRTDIQFGSMKVSDATDVADFMQKTVGIENYAAITSATDTKTNVSLTSTAGVSDIANLYDGIFTSTASSTGNVNVKKDENNKWIPSGTYFDITYDLGAVYNLTGIVALDNGRYNLGKYKVLVSADSEDYVNNGTANFTEIIDYDLYNTRGATLVDLETYKGHAYKITGNNIKAKYVVLRVYANNCLLSGDQWLLGMLRFHEFSVSGTLADYDDTLYVRGNSSGSIKAINGTAFKDSATATTYTDLGIASGKSPINTPNENIGFWTYNPNKGYISSGNTATNTSDQNQYFIVNGTTLHDGNLTAGFTCYGGKNRWDAQNSKNVDGSYYDLVYDLGKPYKLSDIVIASSSQNWQIGAYSIYTAMNRSDRFNNENLTKIVDYSIVNSTNLANQTEQNKGNFQQAFTFNNDVVARYVILRVTENNLLFGNKGVDFRTPLRIGEFAIFGTETTGEVYSKAPHSETFVGVEKYNTHGNGDLKSYMETYLDYFDIKRNLLADKLSEQTFIDTENGINTPTVTTINPSQYYLPTSSNLSESYTYTDTTTNETVTAGKTELQVNWLGKYNNKDVNMCFAKGSGEDRTYIDDESARYYQQTYTLDGQADISAFAVAWHVTSALVTSHFKVSIANSKEDLFTDEAVYTKEYTDNTKNVILNNFDGTSVRGKYFAIRVICGVQKTNNTYDANACYIRIARLGLLGEYVNVDDGTGSGNTASHNLDSDQLSIEPVSVNNPAPAQGAAKDWNSKYAQGMYHSTYTASESTEYTDGTPYVFKGWYKGEQLVSNNASVTAAGALTAKYALPEYKVTFKDKKGTVIKETNVQYGLNADAPTAPAIYGYNFNGWSASVQDIKADTTVTPTYTRNNNLKGTLTVNEQNMGEYAFDKRIELTSKTEVLWEMNEEHLAKGTTATFYALPCDMDVTTSVTDDEPNAASVIGQVKETNADGTKNITAFIRNNKANITDSGVILGNITGTNIQPEALKSCIDKTNAENKANGVQVVKTGITAADYMVTFNGVGSTNTRFAMPYVVVNGEVVLGTWVQIN